MVRRDLRRVGAGGGGRSGARGGDARHHIGGGLLKRSLSGDHDVGIAAGGADVKLGHGADGFDPLLVYGFGGAAMLEDIAHLAAREADVVGRVDVNPGAEERTEVVPMKREETFQNEVSAGSDRLPNGGASVQARVVNRTLDGRAGGERGKVLAQEVVIEGIGNVEVELVARFLGKKGEVAIVSVHGNDDGGELPAQAPGELSLAGTRRAGDGDDVGSRQN
jgi:hypothetical protein